MEDEEGKKKTHRLPWNTANVNKQTHPRAVQVPVEAHMSLMFLCQSQPSHHAFSDLSHLARAYYQNGFSNDHFYFVISRLKKKSLSHDFPTRDFPPPEHLLKHLTPKELPKEWKQEHN